jgi:ribonuclease Z
MEVVVLGSGTPNPTPERAGSALAVVDGSGWLLIDCGRAATHRALEAGLDLTAVTAVLLTHHHSDHISDLATFATTRWTAGAAAPLTVVAPFGPSARYAEACLSIFDDQCFYGQAHPHAGARPHIRVDGFESTPDVTTVLDADGWSVSSTLVHHHPVEPAVGYRIERAGVTVTVSGDTAVCDGIQRLAERTDVLVHEALLAAAVSPALLEWNAAAREVGELAAVTQPGTLVLTHLIPAPNTPADDDAFLTDARRGGYDGPTHIAHDLLRVSARP